MIYETDTDKVLVWNGSAWVYSITPQTLEPGIYTDVSSTQVFFGFTKGNATVISKYARIGDLVHFWGQVTLGSTSSMTGALDVQMPVTAVGTALTNQSSCAFYDGSVVYWGFGLHITTANLRLVAINASTTYARNADTSSTVPFTWGNGDVFYWNHTYEAA
jgi:hypothetical protein